MSRPHSSKTAALTPEGSGLGAWLEADAPLLPRALRRSAGILPNLFAHRALWLAGARREIRARLAGTLLGKLWPLVQPLVLFAVYYTLFARVFGMDFKSRLGQGGAAMGVYLFLGVAVWTAFAEGLSRGTLAFTERGELIKRVAFPAEVLPLQAILAQQILLLVGLGGFVALTLCTDLWPTPGARLLWLPLLFVLQALFTLGLALATATLHALLRDTLHVVAMLSTLWMFATPIFWIPSAEVLPGVAPFLPWLEWNPMHAFISCWRQMLMGDAPQEAFTGSFMTSLAHATAWTAVALACGSFLFALGERRLPDEI
jgi:ABC-type polysaccharide/polyol phosphate export permease